MGVCVHVYDAWVFCAPHKILLGKEEKFPHYTNDIFVSVCGLPLSLIATVCLAVLSTQLVSHRLQPSSLLPVNIIQC